MRGITKNLLIGVCIASGLGLGLSISTQAIASDDAIIKFSKIDNFRASQPSKKDFGRLQFLSGAVLSSQHGAFAGWSGLQVLDNGRKLLCVSDRGSWLQADLKRDKDGALISFENAKIGLLSSLKGNFAAAKWEHDAEGLFVKGDKAFVSFERLDEVRSYSLADMDATPKPVAIDIPEEELRQNEGMEGLAIAPQDTPLNGAMIAVSEGSINKQGDYYAFILDGPQRGNFFIRPSNNFNLTGADFLPNGDLLVLERRFNLRQGLDIQIRQILAQKIVPQAIVDGEIIFEADLSERIDNLEGMSIWNNEANETIISLISDDNDNFLQSTIYLEFRYMGPPKS